MGEGWLKIYRKFTDWEWYGNSEMVHLFLHLLLKAAPFDKTWRGVKICRGQVIVGRQKLSSETGISEMKIRTCISRLQASGEITIESSNRFSIVTICKYDDYQPQDDEVIQQDNQQNNQRDNQPVNHNIRSKEYIISSSKPTNVGSEEVSKQKKTPKRKDPENYTIVTKGRVVFEQYFKGLFDTDYVWSSKEASNMKSLLGKLTSSRKSKNLPLDDDSVVSALEVFLNAITDEWILEHLSLDIIVKNYNRIVAQARAHKQNKNGTNTQANAHQSTSANIIERQRAACVNDLAKADELYYKQMREQGSRGSEEGVHPITDNK